MCTDTPSHGIYSDMYPLWMGLVPEPSVPNVWKSLSSWGLENIGDYGAFVYFHALAMYPAGDKGEAALKALTKCDTYSWCHMIEAYDATMTREARQPPPPVRSDSPPQLSSTKSCSSAAGGWGCSNNMRVCVCARVRG